MISDLLTLLITDLSSDLQRAGVGLQQPLSALKVGGARAKARKVNFLVFNGEESKPVLLLKLPRSQWYEGRLRNEYMALTEIAQLKGISGTAPKPLGIFDYRKHVILIEECLPGISMSNLLRRHSRSGTEKMQKDLNSAMAWLHLFQQETKSDTIVFDGPETIAAAMELVAQYCPGFSFPVAFEEHLLALAKEFNGVELIRTGCHGDYWPGNCLISGSQMSVIDWEHFSRGKSPLIDAFVFLTTYARTYPSKGWRWGSRQGLFKHSFLEDSSLSRIVRTAAANYFRSLGLPQSSLHLFYSLFLIEMSCSGGELDRDEQQANRWLELLNIYAENWTQSIFLK